MSVQSLENQFGPHWAYSLCNAQYLINILIGYIVAINEKTLTFSKTF